MKLYLLERDDPDYGWDIYLGFVIAADSEEEALEISINEGGDDWKTSDNHIEIKELGYAGYDIEKGIIMDSFLAG